MGDRSKIEWTDATWNPVLGCSKVSPGCDNCYAITMSRRIETTGNEAYRGITIRDDWTGLVRCLPERLDQPLRWKRPRRVFVNSMSDLFHPDVPPEFIARVWHVMERAEAHVFQILTKRPQRMARWVQWYETDDEFGEDFGPLPNVWLGTSIEENRYAFRANHLRSTSAAVRFLSLEPLLGPLPALNLSAIDWVIVGGESGPGARPMHPDWVRDIRSRCQTAGVPFFFKQWGEWSWTYGGIPASAESVVLDNGAGAFQKMWRVGKRAAGRILDGCTWDEMPRVHSGSREADRDE
ncbi:MAG: phage Gp37/Gp68 family protein [Acidimicrobiia bacterium]|nr:phage Gp37/Gp68 family protein [Acidimicrobiia bacterium]